MSEPRRRLEVRASMRPPEFTGGNNGINRYSTVMSRARQGFNEAAGIHRRKPAARRQVRTTSFSQQASMRPPEFTGGNACEHRPNLPPSTGEQASMRPPEFTGGNVALVGGSNAGFNEAAGIHRRKRTTGPASARRGIPLQ